MAEQSITRIIIRISLWLGLVAVAVAGVMAYMMREQPLQVTVAPVGRAHVTETVAAITSGTVMTPNNAKLAVAGAGVVSAIHVEEGQHVEKDAILLELAHDELDSQVTLAEANIAVGSSRVNQARIAAQIAREVAEIEVRRTTSALQQAETDFQRVKALADKQAISQSDYDKVALALKIARDARAAAEAGQREAQARDEEIKIAEANVAQLNAALEAARAVRDKAFLKAPFSGVIAKKIVQVGEAVVLGMPVLYLIQQEGMYIEAPFDEANLSSIQVGQPAEIEIDSCPGKIFRGRLDYISPVVTIAEQLSRNLICKIKIEEGAEKFLSGMSADVTVITEEKDNVLNVPTESLIRDEYAFVLNKDRAERRAIKVGIGNWDQREIIEGLKEGDTLITSVSVRGLKDGSLVQVVKELAN